MANPRQAERDSNEHETTRRVVDHASQTSRTMSENAERTARGNRSVPPQCGDYE
jgi:hypothetical protein